jgi:hypothetical protein
MRTLVSARAGPMPIAMPIASARKAAAPVAHFIMAAR